ncbi:MAG: hypothetical protein JJE51_04365 [Thermoanaerobaculia bacterium]|nr:hypothetical protein [Thermoanaerobaculia bacterium]
MKQSVVLSLVLFLAVSANAAVIASLTASNEVLVPVAGSGTGVNGTFFRSDIRVTNLRSQDQLVHLFWLPQDRTGIGIAPIVITIPANGKISSEDFTTDVMNQTGLGAIVARAVRDDGSIDTEGVLDVSTRIWTPATTGQGTVSQNLDSLEARRIVNRRVVILGQRRDERFRTNVGIINLDRDTPQTYRITVSGDNPTLIAETKEVPVEPYSMVQVALPGFAQPNLSIDIEVLPIPGGGFGTLWAAYGASVDNVNGDSWSSIAFNRVGSP